MSDSLDAAPQISIPMLVMTKMLRPPAARIGAIGNIALPRTIPVVTLAAVIVGAFVGLLFAFAFFGVGISSTMYGLMLGGLLGAAAVTLSPLQGESLGKWLGLVTRSTLANRVQIDGRSVRLYIGVAPLHRSAAGHVRALPGAVPMRNADDRGQLVAETFLDMNLYRSLTGDPSRSTRRRP